MFSLSPHFDVIGIPKQSVVEALFSYSDTLFTLTILFCYEMLFVMLLEHCDKNALIYAPV